MSSSRIFVKGLPPNYSESDFRRHFSQRHPVTDIKLFPHRRIGYVGFKTPEDAASAIKYFNKSFIRMSRLSVELANNAIPKSLSNDHTSRIAPTAQRNSTQPFSDTTNPLKRKRNSDSGKFQVHHDHDSKPSAEPQIDYPAEEESPRSKGEEKAQQIASHSPSTEGRDKDEDDGTAIVEGQHEIVDNMTTDADWMRSRTSRLLGLVDDDNDNENDNEPHTSLAMSNDNLDDLQTQQPTPPSEGDEEEDEMKSSADETEKIHRNSEEETIRETRRLFLRNMAYSATEDDLYELFGSKGSILEAHIPLDTRTGQSKGIAFIEFEEAEDAVQAFQHLDRTVFQGRILHILPGSAKHESKLTEFDMAKLPLKKQRQLQKKKEASSSTFNWNAMFMNPNAVMSSISDRLGVAKSELLDPSASDAAVKQAQAETHIIQETKSYFEQNGVDLDAFKNRKRGDQAILVKNFPYGTTKDDLKNLFSEFGTLSKILMPPSGTIAIVEFDLVTQARAAFSKLAYRKFRDSVLFLEKAPKGIFGSGDSTGATRGDGPSSKPSGTDLLGREDQNESDSQSTLFVRNLNFSTTNDRFERVFKPLDGLRSARIKTKPNPKRPGEVLSMGFGFLEFNTSAQATAALKAMNGYELDGFQLNIRFSQKGADAAEQRRKEDKARRNKMRKSKVIIKNLPFEASKKDVRNLFKSYGQLRAVRVPKKFDGSRKGFAFAEFTTSREAENAMDALRETHFLGRRLVLDFAEGEVEDPEEELEKMREKVGRQSNHVELQRLSGPRKRFRTDVDELMNDE